ncbi:MAG: hypothetical protein JO317_05450, partial [Verrucomicrobiae bacterium]|nr:hypothetical protein [Verrucomicrobiae bacterium]
AGVTDGNARFQIGSLRQEYLLKSALAPGDAGVAFEPGQSWTLLWDASGLSSSPGSTSFRPSPLGRTLWLRPLSSLEDLPQALERVRGLIQAVGTDLPPEEVRRHDAVWKALGATRICSPGRMQAPPLTWPNGGASLLKQLMAATAPASKPARAGTPAVS